MSGTSFKIMYSDYYKEAHHPAHPPLQDGSKERALEAFT